MSSPRADKDHSGDSTPTNRSPRTVSSTSRSTPDYRMFLHDLDDQASDKSATGFHVVHKSTNAPDLAALAPTKILLLLTPVVLSEHSAGRLPDKERSDPFEALGRKLSKHHRRIRHVPYLARVGLTTTHEAFLQEADAVIFVTAHNLAADSQSESDRGQQRDRWEVLSMPFVMLRYGHGERKLRADSPHEDMAEPFFPTEQQCDEAVKLLFGPAAKA